MKIFSTLCAAFAIIFLAQSCLVMEHKYTAVAPGKWRAVLLLEDTKQGLGTKKEPAKNFEAVSQGELPFNFEVIYTDANNFYIELINGSERVKASEISIGRDRATGKDTLLVKFPAYDSYIKAIYEGNVMQGKWVVASKENYSIPFSARQGQDYRFSTLRKEPLTDISGTWEASFEDAGNPPEKAVGEFQQKGNFLTGTFLTESGDYRYLEGTVQANKIYLSCFDGTHAFLFEGKLTDENNLTGFFKSGIHYKTTWSAKRNPQAALPDAYNITKIIQPSKEINLDFLSSNNQKINLQNADYQGKVKIIQVSGTWCPNCKDETNFLTNYIKNNNFDDLAIIGLYFERYKESEKANQHLEVYKKLMQIPWQIAFVGEASKETASKSFPQIDKIRAFPTLLIVDKQNKIRLVHTGFSGPATSKYSEFAQNFDKLIRNLLKK